jgi:hypothetical protein
MSLLPNGTALQTGRVSYTSSGEAGAVNTKKPFGISSYTIGINVADGSVLRYGDFVVLDTDGGVRLPINSDTRVQGAIAYANATIMNYPNGIIKGDFVANPVAPVLDFGEIVVKVKTGETLKVGDKVYLYYGSGIADPDYNTLSTSATTAIDISAQVRVAHKSIDGKVAINFVQYAK